MFINDLLIYYKSKEEHGEHLAIILQVLREHKLYNMFEKCYFWLTKVQFLQHLVIVKSILVDPIKVETMMKWERPKNVFEIKSFLVLASYYRRFVEKKIYRIAPLLPNIQENE